MNLASDTVVRAVTEDGAFRVITARTTDTVRDAVAVQKARGPIARQFGDLLTGAILYREAMAPTLRVQGIVKSSGKGSLVADSHPDGSSRGLVNFKGSAGALEGGRGAVLQMMRTLPSGALHQGLVELPEGGSISEALMAYMQESEQVVSMIGVATLFDGDEVVSAGGYLVQLLPEVERGPLMLMTERLAHDFGSFDEVLKKTGGSADVMLDELLYGMPFQRTESSPLRFGCQCSDLRLMASLATLPRADIEEMLKDGKVLDIRCDYCCKDYQINPEQLRTLLTSS